MASELHYQLHAYQLHKIADEDVVAAMSGEGGGGERRVFAAVHTCAHAHIHVHVTGITEARINWLLDQVCGQITLDVYYCIR